MKRLFLSSSFGKVANLLKDFTDENIIGKKVTFISTASLVEDVTLDLHLFPISNTQVIGVIGEEVQVFE